MAKDYKQFRRIDWDEIKEEVMYDGIKAKFFQYPELRSLLIGTEHKTLLEKSDHDFFWGIGLDGTGKNIMGKLLMKLREELNKNDL